MRREFLPVYATAVLAACSPAYGQSGGEGDDEPACERGESVEIEYCYDGDTCRFTGFAESVRLARIDTPEMDGACSVEARRAKRKIVELLESTRQICVEVRERGKYDRLISEIYADGVNVNDWMLAHTPAVEYGKDTCDSDDPSDRKADEQRTTQVQCTDDVDCGELETCGQARAFLMGCEGDPHGLDGDDDGVPCESLCE